MTVTEVRDLFRQYIDEPDSTFVTDAMVATMLARAYDEFRRLVMEVDDTVFTYEVTISPVSSSTYDLDGGAVKVFGADTNLTDPRMMKLIALHTTTDTLINTPLEPVTGPQSLAHISGGFYLDGTTVKFSEKRSGDLVLRYFPQYVAPGGGVAANASNGYIDWTVGGAGSFIDNLSMFHDLVALLAAKQYFIMDGAVNEPLAMQLNARNDDMARYLTERGLNGSQYVQRVYTGYELGG